LEINEDISKTSSLDASISNLSGTTLPSSDEELEHHKIDVFDRNEFDNLIETKQYAITEKKKQKLPFRQYQVLKAGKWQDTIITKLWDINVNINLKEIRILIIL